MKKIIIVAILFLLLIVCSGCSSGSVSKQTNTQSNSSNLNGSSNNLNSFSSSQVKGDHSSSSLNDKYNPTSSPKNENNSTSTLNSQKKLAELQKKGLEIIENQSFWVEFEKWGKVRFISSQFRDGGTYKLQFYLVDNTGNILYSFPEFYGSKYWFFYKLHAISFKDVNKDGLKDIIVIADYVSGAGETGAIPFHVGSIYFQKDKEFINIPELDEQINDAKQNVNINSMLKFIEGKNLKLNM